MHRRATIALVLLAGCGQTSTPPPATTASQKTTPARAADPPQRKPTVRRAHCTPGAANCAAATGRIIYIEAHDPDGDGDLHLVVVGGSVTFPGISVFDIEKALRPRRIPRLGDLASAAGPVYRGSYGQKQIQATELHIAYR